LYLKKRKFNPPVSFDSKQYFDRQSYLVDRLLYTNMPSIENSNVPKETVEISPTEPIIREEGETWTNDEG